LAAPLCVPGFLVLGPCIERLAFVGPLLAAIVAGDERKTSRGLRIGVGNLGRPADSALGIAIRLAGAIAVEDVARHSIEIDEGLALDSLGAGRRQRRGRRETDDAAASCV
jgi:hypothetical protein